MISSPKSIAIVGAGVIGLSIARELLRAGARVQVFDKGKIYGESSWAAAGMLAVAAESEPGSETIFALARASQERWPAFALALEAESGVDLGYSQGETLVVAQNDDQAAHLHEMVQYLRTLDEPARLIKAPHDLEGELAQDAQLALLSPNDGQVDNRALGEALRIAVERAGGMVIENAAVDDIAIKDGRAIGVVVGGELIEADHVILAAGAWSAFPSVQGAIPKVRPVKGQMLAFQSEPGRLNHILWGQGVYIVPRKDGRIIIGATMEEVGFDPSVNLVDIESQKAKAANLLPFLGDLAIDDHWAGLRPASADGLPIMGPSTIDSLTLATAHFRNGILLAPICAELITRGVINGEPPAALLPFLPTRFGAA